MPPRDREFDPTTHTEFETLVKQLIYAAHENHIDAEGGIDVRHPTTGIPDWTVEITRIEEALQRIAVVYRLRLFRVPTD